MLLVHVALGAEVNQDEVTELAELAGSTNVEIKEIVTLKRQTPHAKYFIGTGKADEIHDLVKYHKIDCVIFNNTLSPAQERNCEKLWQTRVLGRTTLILDIFASRARTFEGKLQVELAQLKHLSTRLIRGWTHLERQKGGIGLRGPGETQLEVDRRLIGKRIKRLTEKLEKVKKVREQGRAARQRSQIPVVSLVGYTNAGKSTLFNTLTESDVYSADKLFATLDPTFRQFSIEPGKEVILADTVGFIRHLPHDLVAAFRATLEETVQANCLLHVIDASAPDRAERMAEVDSVLKEIGAEKVPTLLVMNKIDRLGEHNEPRIDYTEQGEPYRVWLSALHPEGSSLLQQALMEKIFGRLVEHEVVLPPAKAKARAILYDKQAVIAERSDEHGNWVLLIKMNGSDYEQFVADFLG